ncbi:hypothetical protein [Mucilaginibacter paludis]|uniref:hypothetical protein n=1 Tax=Mucilaginibacter paludis TaxID=423351 RepID=UPI00030C6A93|nr:hypothetical protein [Mucilaginibacter paludis]
MFVFSQPFRLDVLPLGLKPPIIPLSVLILAGANIFYTIKLYKKNAHTVYTIKVFEVVPG